MIWVLKLLAPLFLLGNLQSRPHMLMHDDAKKVTKTTHGVGVTQLVR